jgi:integrase
MVTRSETTLAWCAYQRRRNLSPGTIDNRMRLLRRWWDHTGDVWSADHHALEAWIDQQELGAPSSRYTAISHLHCFYRWALRTGRTDRDPTVMIDRPRLRQRLPRPIHPTDLDVAVLTADGKMRVALLLAATSGLRCCELARLRWDDVHDGRARVLGKGDRERVVPIHRLAIVALDELDRSSVFVLDGWQTRSAANPGRQASRLVNRHLRTLGITATAHQLRHYAGTAALKSAGGNLRKVQVLLGHASPATTALYTALDVDDLVDVVEGIPIGR